MADYILQEATLALPDVFKDRTMNLFTMSDNGASEFTFVVSRATAKTKIKSMMRPPDWHVNWKLRCPTFVLNPLR